MPRHRGRGLQPEHPRVRRRQIASSVAAACADCHTAHEIRTSKDPASTTYPLNLPATCSRCHGDPAIIKQGHIAIGNVATLYKDSIHGRAMSKSGLLVAANCKSCHGSHDIRQKSDPASRVNRANIPATCGACHEGVMTQYIGGVHGAAFARGQRESAGLLRLPLRARHPARRRVLLAT